MLTLEALRARCRVCDVTGCWNILGNRASKYPEIQSNGIKKRASHWAIWFITGEWPEPGRVVMHKCDNPRCANPEHLKVATQSENVLDAYRKGRLKSPNKGRKLSQSHRARLSDSARRRHAEKSKVQGA